MGLRSIEPVELVGCACDGYNQVERMVEARFAQVEAVALPWCAFGGQSRGDASAVADAVAALTRAGVPVFAYGAVEGALHDDVDQAGACSVATWHEVEGACARTGVSAGRVLVAGRSGSDLPWLAHAWLSVALRDAVPEVVGTVDAQISYAAKAKGTVALLRELADR